MAKRIEVEIIGDASSLNKALRSSQSSLGAWVKSGAAFGVGLEAVRGGMRLLGDGLRAGIGEWQESTRVAAQTAAVLKSTGQAANVTAQDVDKLATALMKKSGVDDEAIASGQNLLLTFTKIHNEAGKGNDIFNQATKATLDLSVAMGKDMSSSAILVGKALNDPVKGMTALTKAGIQFTDAQKATIKKMVETGDVMGAQKLILEELTTQFGGSAEAAGKTLPGQLDILRQSFNNLAGDLVAKAAPALQQFVGFLNERFIPAEGFTAKLKVVWEGVSEVAVDLWAQLKTAILGGTETIFIPTEKRIELVETEGLAAKLKEQLKAAISAIDWSDVLVTVGVAIGKGVLQLQLKIWQFLFDAWKGAWGLILSTVASEGSKFVDTLITAISSLPGRFRGAIQTAMTQGVAAITGAIVTAAGAALTLGTRVVSGVVSGLAGIGGKVLDKLNDIIRNIATTASNAFSAAIGIGSSIISGVVSGLSGLAGRVGAAIRDGISAGIKLAGRVLHGSGDFEFTRTAVGEPLARGIVEGATSFLNSNLSKNLSGVMTNALNSSTLTDAADAGGTDIATTMKGGIDEFLGTNLPDNLKQVLGLAFSEATAGLDLSAAGLGFSFTTPTLPAPRPDVAGGPTRIADPDANTIVVNNYAPIGSEQDLQNMVVSALSKVNARGGLT